MLTFYSFRLLRNSAKLIVACSLLGGWSVQSAGICAQDKPPVEETPPATTDPDSESAEKPESDEPETPPEPRKETREERRERLRYMARNGLGSTINLIALPQIQRELKITEAQQKSIGDQIKKMRLHVQFKSREVRDLPRDQQAAEMQKIQQESQAFIQQKQKELKAVLTEEQRLRLLGISLQMRGPRSLIDDEVIELLELSDEQVEKILVILEKFDTALQMYVSQPPETSDTPLVSRPRTPRLQLREAAEKDILEVLTETQRQKFQELKGEPFLSQPGDGGKIPTLIEPAGEDEKKTVEEKVPNN